MAGTLTSSGAKMRGVLAMSALLLVALDPVTTAHAQRSEIEKAEAPTGGESATDIFPEPRFDFGDAMSGAIVEHDFVIHNAGAAPLLIQRVSMTPPLLVTQMPPMVAAGAKARIHVRLDSASLTGPFEGTLWVAFANPVTSRAVLTLTGRIVPSIELSPMRAFFVAGRHGYGGRATLDIINHGTAPLVLTSIEHPTERFTTTLQTVDAGQRYQLTLSLKPDGPVGRATDTIRIATSSASIPTLMIDANTYLYNRVHMFPEVLDFGTVRLSDTEPETLTLMIYEESSSDFQVSLSSDLQAVRLHYERGPHGDRYQATISLQGDRLRPGPLVGTLSIETNDLEFRTLKVPVRGMITP
jgi:hypothetical protein